MKQRTQKYLHAILALVLSLCLITGCSLFPNSAPKADKNTSQETIAEEATENSSDDSASQPDEAALAAAREAFDQYTENLFKQEASQSLLTLHYTLADPESYGITDYDRTLGTASAEDKTSGALVFSCNMGRSRCAGSPVVVCWRGRQSEIAELPCLVAGMQPGGLIS